MASRMTEPRPRYKAKYYPRVSLSSLEIADVLQIKPSEGREVCARVGVYRQATQTGKPQVAHPTGKHLLVHISFAMNLGNLVECVGMLYLPQPSSTESAAFQNSATP